MLQKLTGGGSEKAANGLPLTAHPEILPFDVENQPILKSSQLKYSYPGQPEISFPDFVCDRGGHLLITGNSGTGKTTLLHLLSGLLRVQKGDVEIAGKNLKDFSQAELDRFRGRHVGLVFQQPRFISSLSVIDNIAAAQYFGAGKSDRSAALGLLESLGIADKASKPTGELSGGERQRLAIARALAAKPAVVMADEPTSSLDDENAELVYNLLARESSDYNAALVVVSHDGRLKEKFQNRVEL